MQEYHAKYPTTDTLPNPKPTQPRPFMTLALQYGLTIMQIAPSAKSQEDSGHQSVEDEFASYMATVSHSNADVLVGRNALTGILMMPLTRRTRFKLNTLDTQAHR